MELESDAPCSSMPDARGIEEEDCWMGYKMEGAALER
jgi:hypothetical protein